MTNIPSPFYSHHYLYRPYTVDDVALLIQLYEDWNWEAINENWAKNHLENLIFKQYQQNNAGVFAIFDKNTSEYHGHCGLKYIVEKDEWFLSFRFMKSFWKNDQPLEVIESCLQYGFNRLQLNEIIVDLDARSRGAAKMLLKAGFKLRQQYTENDLLLDRYSVFS